MNINTLVEIIIHYAECHDWRKTFELSIPVRKVKVEDERGNDFDYHKIKSLAELESISEYRINRYELKHALHIFCEKTKKKYSYDNREISYEEYEEKTKGENRNVVLNCRNGKEATVYAIPCQTFC